jgi:hypothetical protein
LSAARLLDGTAEWATLLGAALAYLALALALVRRERFRELGALALAAALAVGGIAAADALLGSSLSIVWAAEGALLVWLAARTRELRFELAGLLYLALAAVHALAVEAAPDHLLEATAHSARGAQGAAAAGVAAIFASVFAGRTREPVPDQGVMRHLAPALAAVNRNVRARREVPFHGGALLCLYAGALGILGLFQVGDAPVQTAFEHGHVAVTAAWAAAALAAILAAPALSILREAGYAWLALALVKLVGFDLLQLSDRERAAAALAVGAAALLAAQVDALRSGPRIEPVRPQLSASASRACSGRRPGSRAGTGTASISRARPCSASRASTSRSPRSTLRTRRDFATALWAIGLGVAAVGTGLLLHGSWLVLAWAATAAALALLGYAIGEERLAVGALAYLVLPLLHALGEDARRRTSSSRAAIRQPESARSRPSAPPRSCRPLPSRRTRSSRAPGACSSSARPVLAVYACSLGLLELFERLGSAGVQTSFQRGHTAVSTFWALIGVALLYAGLVRRGGRSGWAGWRCSSSGSRRSSSTTCRT